MPPKRGVIAGGGLSPGITPGAGRSGGHVSTPQRKEANMNVGEIRVVKDVLSEVVGWKWPYILIKGLARKKAIFASTQWAKERDSESSFVRRFSLPSALFLELADRIGRQEAFAAMRRILVPIGCSEQWSHLRSLKDSATTPMRRLMAFHDLMDERGAPQFNRREYVERSDNTCHFVITRCVFNDFFTEAGTPELTRLFCEVDSEFFPAAFPEFTFHRGHSCENTIAFGEDRCEFIFESANGM
jgi:hypothetical protein